MTLPDWDLAARDETPVSDPVNLPDLCPIAVFEGRGTWSNECWHIFENYEEAAEANFTIAQENANALRNTEGAYDHLIEAGKLQQQLAIIRQEMLERERRAHTMDNWFYRAIIALGLIGATL